MKISSDKLVSIVRDGLAKVYAGTYPNAETGGAPVVLKLNANGDVWDVDVNLPVPGRPSFALGPGARQIRVEDVNGRIIADGTTQNGRPDVWLILEDRHVVESAPGALPGGFPKAVVYGENGEIIGRQG